MAVLQQQGCKLPLNVEEESEEDNLRSKLKFDAST